MRFIPLLLSTLLTVVAQRSAVPQSTAWPDRLPVRDEPKPASVDPRLGSALAALKAGEKQKATAVLEAQYAERPADVAVLEALIRATDGERRLEWAHRHAALVTTPRGAYRARDAIRRLLPKDDPHIAAVASARARAVDELARFAKQYRSRQASHRLIVRWATDLVARLTRNAPTLVTEHAAELNRLSAPDLEHVKNVLNPLTRVMSQAASRGPRDLAIRVGVNLQGFVAQARFPKLQGPRPKDLGRAKQAIARLRRLRESSRKEQKAFTVKEVRLFTSSPNDRRAFTERYRSIGKPAVCASPSHRYRIETTCGFDTMVLAANTVEYHHARLARWYGSDPFAKKPGIVRIVPESEHLEAEGAPYWWAGGFQRGDETTVRFAWGSPAGLGRLITHELTHRFDGHFYPGLPAWLAEGRAVWTQNAYSKTKSERFAKIHAKLGTIERAYLLGYGGRDKLTKLIEGTIDDPRDNYTAGYALYVYLSTFEQYGRPLFANALEKYTKSFRTRAKAMKRFERSFCDGKKNRPAGFRQFARGFAEFLRGFYWQDRKPWTKRYQTVRASWEGDVLLDRPTRSRRRRRAEPFFGQAQARTAGALLLEANEPEAAAIAWTWALEVDEWTRSFALEAAALLARVGDSHGAWVVRAQTARRFLDPQSKPLGAPPFAEKLGALIRFRRALRAASDHYAKLGHLELAASLTEETAELEQRFGGGPTTSRAAAPSLAAVPRHLGANGWIETGLTGYEERRRRGLWYVDGADLHVGRERPRAGTGTAERRAIQRDAFVRTRTWFAGGRNVIEARIHPSTSYLSGAIVIGYGRRDRNIRIGFSLGDFLYSIGAKEKRNKTHTFSRIRTSITGLNEKTDAMPGLAPRRAIRLDGERTAFTLRVVIANDTVHAWLDDHRIGTARTVGGASIEGAIGFASSQGAYVVRRPTIRPATATDSALTDPPGLDPAVALMRTEKHPRPLNALRNRPVRGVARSGLGTVVLWMPWRPSDVALKDNDTTATDEFAKKTGRRRINAIHRRLESLETRAAFVLALPESVREPTVKALAKQVKRRFGARGHVIRHAWRSAPIDLTAKKPSLPAPWILFVDPAGTLRHAGAMPQGALPRSIRRWLKVTAEETAERIRSR